MFQAFWMGIPSCVSRHAAPGLETWTTLNVPSHMGESVQPFSGEDPPQDEVAPLERHGADVAAVIMPQRLLVPCRS